MDLLIEFFIEVYMELMMLIVPEKNITKKHRVIALIMAFFVLCVVCALVILGLTLIIDNKNYLGIIPLTFAVIISAAQIIAGIVLYKKNH